jgi:hypothetical protein
MKEMDRNTKEKSNGTREPQGTAKIIQLDAYRETRRGKSENLKKANAYRSIVRLWKAQTLFRLGCTLALLAFILFSLMSTTFADQDSWVSHVLILFLVTAAVLIFLNRRKPSPRTRNPAFCIRCQEQVDPHSGVCPNCGSKVFV